MGANIEREAVKKIGRSPEWPSKVDKMSDQKVIAIYLRLKAEGKL
jgi:hypothetical protein